MRPHSSGIPNDGDALKLHAGLQGNMQISGTVSLRGGASKAEDKFYM